MPAGWQPSTDSFAFDLTAGDGAYQEMRPPTVVDFGPLLSVDGRPLDYFHPPATHHPGVGRFILPNGTIALTDGVVLLRDGKILAPASWYRDAREHAWYSLDPRECSEVHLPGRSFSFASEFASGNYAHFLLDGVGRFAALASHAPDILPSCDRVLCSGPPSHWKQRLLKHAGVPFDRVFWLEDRRYRCDELIATSLPAFRRSYPPWLCESLRSRFVVGNRIADCPRRKLFIGRKGKNRTLHNELELFEIAATHGFEYYLPEAAEDSIKDFAEATAVIAAHGAGMADIVFMRPQSLVVELMPSDHRHCYFLTLGRSSRLDYQVLIGPSDEHRQRNAWGPSPYGFCIDEARFRRLLFSIFVQ